MITPLKILQILEGVIQVSEVQNIQIAENNVEHGALIPLYMVFPRYYACPTLATHTFKISFQVTIRDHSHITS